MASQEMRAKAEKYLAKRYADYEAVYGKNSVRYGSWLHGNSEELLADFAAAERALVIAEAMQICDNEKVDADDTKSEEDIAYNAACTHIKHELRALASPAEEKEGEK